MKVTVTLDTTHRCPHCNRTMFYVPEEKSWKCPTYLLFDYVLEALADYDHASGKCCKHCGGPIMLEKIK